MPGRDNKDKAGDIFARSESLFARKAPFAKPFPSVKHAAIEVTEQDAARRPARP